MKTIPLDIGDKWNVYAMSALYFLAGVNHFYNPYFYLDVIPEGYYNPEFLVAISGFAEMLLAIMLLFRDLRKSACWMIIVMLAVFLAAIHIPMAVSYYLDGNSYLWVAVLRIPVQALLIRWALKVSRIRKF